MVTTADGILSARACKACLGVLLLLALYGCDTGYQRKDGSFVYVTWDEGRGRLEHPISGVDTSTFQVLTKNGYAKDRRHVYFGPTRLDGADVTTFVALTDAHAKDSRSVYFEREVISGADPATFVLVGGWWGRDKNDVYLQNRAIKACEPTTFRLLQDGWQRDSKCIYNGTHKFVGADPDSFVVINSWYAKDKDRVYLRDGKIIRDADPTTFTLKGCIYCARDKNGCYRLEKSIPC